MAADLTSKKRVKRDAQAANRAEFQACVAVKFPKARIETLFDWFRRDSDGSYVHGDIEEMWTGWNMHKDFISGELAP